MERPTLSINAMGAAPEPPSPESSVKKSGETPRSLIFCIRWSSQPKPPTTVFRPTGFRVICFTLSMKSSSSSLLLISGWRVGLIESSPTAIPQWLRFPG